MPIRRPQLPALDAFRRVVELNSFAAAARSLGLSGGAVSKLVAQLEQDLGVRLLHRTTRSLSVSTEGQVFYRDAVRLLDELDYATETLRDGAGQPHGRLRVSLPTSFALSWLAPRLPAFLRAHPQLELDLVLNDHYVDLVREGFDCAIRIATTLPDSSLVARRLGKARRLLVAAPAYLEVAPPLRSPADLDTHACLLFSQDGGAVEWPLHGAAAFRPQGHCRANHSLMLRELLLDGLGLTLTPEFVVADLLQSGRLVELLPSHRPTDLSIYGVVGPARLMPRKVGVFLEFVAGCLQPAIPADPPGASGA